MSYPPPPGGPPPPSNPVPPHGYSGQWGPPPQQPPPWPQQQWQPGPPPRKRGNGWKWALGAVALLAVIGVTVAVTVSMTSDSGNDDDPTPPGETYGLASADDTGPVSIITEDPSCAAWKPINQTFADIQKRGWNKRDPAIPASQWTSEQRTQYEDVAKAARQAADQTVTIAKLTPNRVMRELYEQYIAYARAYSDAIPTYEADDEALARVMINTGAAIYFSCNAIQYGSAEARAPLVDPLPSPSEVAPLQDPGNPSRFLVESDPSCSEWSSLAEEFETNTEDWQAIDPGIPASGWSPEQRAVINAVTPVMQSFAQQAADLGRRSPNPVFQDFVYLVAQYRQAYAEALPTYTAADSWLASVAGSASAALYNACKAAGA